MKYTDNETLIKEFKKVLIDNGIKQQFIADKLEISKQSLNLLMNKKHITFDDMQKLLEAAQAQAQQLTEDRRFLHAHAETGFELNATFAYVWQRLEEAGHIASYWGDSGAGARRRYYTITPSGRDAYHRLMLEWEETREIMNKLLTMEVE